jgi:hypothetical protein
LGSFILASVIHPWRNEEAVQASHVRTASSPLSFRRMRFIASLTALRVQGLPRELRNSSPSGWRAASRSTIAVEAGVAGEVSRTGRVASRHHRLSVGGEVC